MTEFADAGERHVARSKVKKEAEDGRPPHALHSQDDLAWAFEGHEDELAELEELAVKVQNDRLEQEERRELRRDIHAWTEELVKKWKRQEENELREKAHAEVLRGLSAEQRRLLKLDG
ncbi:MAG TPA: hypothetical protein VJ716_04585 [Gaiellaceae bacterium]|nr:hypothetical protein [Gaiellaceae bacterium]